MAQGDSIDITGMDRAGELMLGLCVSLFALFVVNIFLKLFLG